ncbi:MAG: regulatory protein RecX [Coriobacteriia bacterium]|nr:regulatory protein RecX [Coriobacteriia bacterium]
MCPLIVRIEDAGPDRKARRLVFDDGSESRLTSAAAVKSLGIAEGLSVSGSILEASLAEVELPLAKERALMLLGYRDRSRAELARKLHDAGYPTAVSAQVVERFVEIELVDDERFAAAWVRTRAAAGYGARRIGQELAQKGIDPDTAAAALEPIAGSDEQLARARAVLRERVPADRKERDKFVRRLVTKGFSLQTAIQALETASDDEEDPDA